jgi:RNA polymerase sigma factor (sigma-70 family)
MTVAFARAGSAAASPPHEAASETSDETLIGRIAGGDQLAMRTLFARHRVALYRWLLRLVRDEALAEDLLSDVFLDVWRQAASFRGRASVSTWLLAIARHKALSARRRRNDAELDRRRTGLKRYASPCFGYRRITARSSTSLTTTASPSKRLPKSLASARRP